MVGFQVLVFVYFGCLFQQLTSLLHQNLKVGMHSFHQLHKWQHANLFWSLFDYILNVFPFSTELWLFLLFGHLMFNWSILRDVQLTLPVSIVLLQLIPPTNYPGSNRLLLIIIFLYGGQSSIVYKPWIPKWNIDLPL